VLNADCWVLIERRRPNAKRSANQHSESAFKVGLSVAGSVELAGREPRTEITTRKLETQNVRPTTKTSQVFLNSLL
jgi:hypothetical protein